MLLADEKIWDQNGFNDIVRRQLGPAVDGDDGLVYAFDGSLKLGVLPASIFCSGHTYFVQVGRDIFCHVFFPLFCRDEAHIIEHIMQSNFFFKNLYLLAGNVSTAQVRAICSAYHVPVCRH